MDTDLEQMTREELISEVKKLRQGIRQHRDSTRHELCWHHPALWGLLPEKTDPLPVVPEWPQFMQAASDIVNHWTSKQAARRALTNPIRNDAAWERIIRERSSLLRSRFERLRRQTMAARCSGTSPKKSTTVS
jgi:hypothetical protein